MSSLLEILPRFLWRQIIQYIDNNNLKSIMTMKQFYDIVNNDDIDSRLTQSNNKMIAIDRCLDEDTYLSDKMSKMLFVYGKPIINFGELSSYTECTLFICSDIVFDKIIFTGYKLIVVGYKAKRKLSRRYNYYQEFLSDNLVVHGISFSGAIGFHPSTSATIENAIISNCDFSRSVNIDYKYSSVSNCHFVYDILMRAGKHCSNNFYRCYFDLSKYCLSALFICDVGKVRDICIDQCVINFSKCECKQSVIVWSARTFKFIVRNSIIINSLYPLAGGCIYIAENNTFCGAHNIPINNQFVSSNNNIVALHNEKYSTDIDYIFPL